jgi:hypothetical protein
MKDSVDTITTAARILSPIAEVKYVHQRNEKKRKRKIVMIENATLSLNKGMIVRHVNDGIHNNKKDMPLQTQRVAAIVVHVLVQQTPLLY